MTLGGLSLAVGILVDESTVAVENIHTQMGKTSSIPRAVLDGTMETAVPRFAGDAVHSPVFLPSFIMKGAAQPVCASLACGRLRHDDELYALQHFCSRALRLAIATFPCGPPWQALFSASVLPLAFGRLVVAQVGHSRGYLSDAAHPWAHSAVRARRPGGCGAVYFRSVPARYSLFLSRLLPFRWVLLSVYVVGACWCLGSWVARWAGRSRRRSMPGSSRCASGPLRGPGLEVTEEITREDAGSHQGIGRGRRTSTCPWPTSACTAPTYTVNSIYLWTGGVDQAVMRISLQKGQRPAHGRIARKLRRGAAGADAAVARRAAQADYKYSPAQATARAAELRFSFEPADVVNQVMSFGSPTPVEIAVSGPNLAANQEYARKIHAELKKIASLKDLQLSQVMDYPRINVDVDRERAGFAGLTMADAPTALIAATSSSRYVVPGVLGRSQERHRLSGAAGSAAAADQFRSTKSA